MVPFRCLAERILAARSLCEHPGSAPLAVLATSFQLVYGRLGGLHDFGVGLAQVRRYLGWLHAGLRNQCTSQRQYERVPKWKSSRQNFDIGMQWMLRVGIWMPPRAR